jgi:hypothetical protein
LGDITIRFRMNVETGKKDIVVEYDSDDDALPHEHERRHKEIVEQLLGKGILLPGEAGEVKVERVKPAPARARENQGPEGQAEAARG